MADITSIPRIFKFENAEFPDPDPNMSPEQVKQFYSVEHPELTTGTVIGPTYKDNQAIFTLSTSYKPKG